MLLLGPYDEALYRIGTLGCAFLLVAPQLYYLLKTPRPSGWPLFLRSAGVLFSIVLLWGVLRFAENHNWGEGRPAQDVFAIWMQVTAIVVVGAITVLSGTMSHKRNQILPLFRLVLELWGFVVLLFAAGYSGYLPDSFAAIVLLFLSLSYITHIGVEAVMKKRNRNKKTGTSMRSIR